MGVSTKDPNDDNALQYALQLDAVNQCFLGVIN